MKKNGKTIIRLFAGLILIVGLFVYGNKAVIFQCGNPIPYIAKFFSLDNGITYVDVFDDKSEYITKGDTSDDLFQFVEDEYME
ncbi:MAG: hypothetical protein CVU98_00725 [Firmicutes bacterium HGW-Firmicutes-3]|jgi:hypothetical protein|nr:MAG: hypothetical protein CVU98_00725 [Firmicutes bacterium HGW-Firmicutes-3]